MKMFDMVKKLFNRIQCNPLACITVYLTILFFFLSPIYGDIRELRADIKELREIVIKWIADEASYRRNVPQLSKKSTFYLNTLDKS